VNPLKLTEQAQLCFGKSDWLSLAVLSTGGRDSTGVAGTLRCEYADIADRDLLLPKTGDAMLGEPRKG